MIAWLPTLGLYIIIVMSELDDFSEYNEDKLLTTDAGQSPFHLPPIQQPLSRASLRSEANNKNKPRLPPAVTVSQERQKNHKANQIKFKKGVKGDRFAQEIEQKLKHVLQNVNYIQNGENEDYNSELDFEEAIVHNKQQFKDDREKRKSPERMQQIAQKGKYPPKPRVVRADNRPNAIFQKKAKQNKQKTEREYVEIKKQVASVKNALIERAMSHKQKNDRKSPQKVKSKKRQQSMAKHQSLKSISKQGRNSANIFDNIHGILESPKGRGVEVSSTTIPENKIQKLEIKIKQINEKLGVEQNLKTKQTEQNLIAQTTVRDWGRFELKKGRNISYHKDSNFQKQIEKVERLQDRNNRVLDSYLEHQKLLVELQYLKKIYPKIESKTQ